LEETVNLDKIMKPSETPKCYCCEQIATTKDHVPAQCFFPEEKHLPSGCPDYRNNLITVPSCSEHNNPRSRDDEYAAVVIAINSKSDLALTMLKSKWVRALLRREGSLGKKIFSTARGAKAISRKNGIVIPYETLAVSYQIERIECVIESIARALYYRESGYQKKWVDSCIIKSLKFFNRDMGYAQDDCTLNQIEQAFIHGEKYQGLELVRKGSNPDVFYYQFFKSDDRNFIIRTVFYSDFTFLAFLKSGETTLNFVF